MGRLCDSGRGLATNLSVKNKQASLDLLIEVHSTYVDQPQETN